MADALKSGNFTEVEPFPTGKAVIGRMAVNDATPVMFDLPLKQK